MINTRKSGDEEWKKWRRKKRNQSYFMIVKPFDFGRLTVEIILYHEYTKHILKVNSLKALVMMIT